MVKGRVKMNSITEKAIKIMTDNAFDVGQKQVAEEIDFIISSRIEKGYSDSETLKAVKGWVDRYSKQ
jgi:hypothetical protein